MYDRLPDDLKRVIREYFTVWQRHGFRREPGVLMPDRDAYYRKIRRRPRVGRWNPCFPTSLYYRRQSDFFEWYVWVRSDNELHDRWTIEMRPQWDFGEETGLAVRVMRIMPWTVFKELSCDMEHVMLLDDDNMMLLEYSIRRPDESSPPTRQMMADTIMEGVVEMARMIEKDRKRSRR